MEDRRIYDEIQHLIDVIMSMYRNARSKNNQKAHEFRVDNIRYEEDKFVFTHQGKDYLYDYAEREVYCFDDLSKPVTHGNWMYAFALEHEGVYLDVEEALREYAQKMGWELDHTMACDAFICYKWDWCVYIPIGALSASECAYKQYWEEFLEYA